MKEQHGVQCAVECLEEAVAEIRVTVDTAVFFLDKEHVGGTMEA